MNREAFVVPDTVSRTEWPCTRTASVGVGGRVTLCVHAVFAQADRSDAASRTRTNACHVPFSRSAVGVNPDVRRSDNHASRGAGVPTVSGFVIEERFGPN